MGMIGLPLLVKLPLVFAIAFVAFFLISLRYHLDLLSFVVAFVIITLLRFVL